MRRLLPLLLLAVSCAGTTELQPPPEQLDPDVVCQLILDSYLDRGLELECSVTLPKCPSLLSWLGSTAPTQEGVDACLASFDAAQECEQLYAALDGCEP
jgi:hypothetical protein